MGNEHVDYATLSVDELIDAANHVDREAFPQIGAMIDAELARRLTASSSAEEPVAEYVVTEADRIAFDEAIDRQLRWRLILFASWGGLLPLEIFIGWPLDKATGSNVPFVLVAFTCMAFFTFSGMKLGMFKCPRCGRPFTRKRHWKNPFTSSCLNCGLTRSGQPRL